MARTRPTAVSLVGWACLSLGLVWLVWLALGRREDALDLVRAGLGDATAAIRLSHRGLAGPFVVQTTILTLVLELTLALVWAAAGVALLLLLPFARRAALFACCAAVVIEGVSTMLRVFFLTPRGQAVALAPIVVNGIVTLCALALWGGLFLPDVEAAYSGPAADGTEAAGA